MPPLCRRRPKEKRRHPSPNEGESMVRKSGNRFSEKIMLNQRDRDAILCNRIMI
jgi:hypothetical protein